MDNKQTATKIQITQITLDAGEDAMRDAGDGLVDMLHAAQEGEDVGQFIGDVNALLDTAEFHLRDARKVLANIATPKQVATK